MVGVDISDRSIKVAELSDEWQPRVLTVGWQAMDEKVIRRGVVQDINMVVDALQQAFSNAAVPVAGDMVTASIPEMQSFVRVLDLPVMSSGEMDEAVQWAIRQHIPFDPSRVYLDWQPLASRARNSNQQQILVGAARRDVIDPLLAVFDATNLKVVALELEAQSIVRSLLPIQSDDVRGILLVDIGATSTNVIFFDRGTMRFTTSIMQGGDGFTQYLMRSFRMTAETAAEQKAVVGTEGNGGDTGVATALREAALGLAQEVERSVRQIMVAQEEVGQKVQAILLSGGSANLPGIDGIFSEVFSGVPVQLGNPWTNLAPPNNKKDLSLSREDMLHFTTAFGCALRREEV